MSIELSKKQIEEGWQVVKFGEIARNISERVEPSETDLEIYVGLEHLDPQSLRITRYGKPSDVIGQKLRVRPGQIIFGKRRAYQKKVAIADFDGICSAHAMVLEAIPGKIIPELLPFFMQSDMFMDRAIAISEGSLSPTIKWKTLSIQEFPLPPIKRQKAIQKILIKIEAILKSINNHLNSLDQLLESVIIDQFSKHKNSIPLSALCNENRELQMPPFDNSERYIGFEHIEQASIFQTRYGKIDSVVSAKLHFQKNNILYGKIRPYLRKVIITSEDGLCSSDLIVLNVNSEISPVVLATIMASSYFAKIAMKSVKGTKMPRADWTILKTTKIPNSFKTKSNQYHSFFKDIYELKIILNGKLKNYLELRNAISNGYIYKIMEDFDE